MTYGAAKGFTQSLLEPFIHVLAHEIVIVQMRISGVDAVNFLYLAR